MTQLPPEMLELLISAGVALLAIKLGYDAGFATQVAQLNVRKVQSVSMSLQEVPAVSSAKKLRHP